MSATRDECVLFETTDHTPSNPAEVARLELEWKVRAELAQVALKEQAAANAISSDAISSDDESFHKPNSQTEDSFVALRKAPKQDAVAAAVAKHGQQLSEEELELLVRALGREKRIEVVEEKGNMRREVRPPERARDPNQPAGRARGQTLPTPLPDSRTRTTRGSGCLLRCPPHAVPCYVAPPTRSSSHAHQNTFIQKRRPSLPSAPEVLKARTSHKLVDDGYSIATGPPSQTSPPRKSHESEVSTCVTRSIGDWDGSRAMTPQPDLERFEVLPTQHMRVVLASDGMWDFITRPEAGKVARKAASPQAAATALVRLASNRSKAQLNRLKDDTTVVVVDLNPSQLKVTTRPEDAAGCAICSVQ